MSPNEIGESVDAGVGVGIVELWTDEKSFKLLDDIKTGAVLVVISPNENEEDEAGFSEDAESKLKVEIAGAATTGSPNENEEEGATGDRAAERSPKLI